MTSFSDTISVRSSEVKRISTLSKCASLYNERLASHDFKRDLRKGKVRSKNVVVTINVDVLLIFGGEFLGAFVECVSIRPQPIQNRT